jgi:hypothetical protein
LAGALALALLVALLWSFVMFVGGLILAPFDQTRPTFAWDDADCAVLCVGLVAGGVAAYALVRFLFRLKPPA